MRKLKIAMKGIFPALVEVMSCKNGCVGGCSSLATPKAAVRQLKKFVESEAVADNALKPIALESVQYPGIRECYFLFSGKYFA